MLEGFIENFEYNIETGENYWQAVEDIVQFSNLVGISLQHVSFDDFSIAMKSKQTFILGNSWWNRQEPESRDLLPEKDSEVEKYFVYP